MAFEKIWPNQSMFYTMIIIVASSWIGCKVLLDCTDNIIASTKINFQYSAKDELAEHAFLLW